jgi:hypothetical protein
MIRFIKPLAIEDLKLTGEFDSGSERTLAARLIHASRARKYLRMRVKRRTGEEHVDNLP